jgi:hypothetical protein
MMMEKWDALHGLFFWLLLLLATKVAFLGILLFVILLGLADEAVRLLPVRQQILSRRVPYSVAKDCD